ncbi:MAG: hypothetical protein JST21_10745 [Bacteroidetes bacterium]|nr:hypothetical protein [Bacteroidota bacterium]
MFTIIQKFFALHHHLNLPGIGSFSVETIPANIDFTNRNITPARHNIIFNNDEKPDEKKLFDFISQELNIDESKAVQKLKEFSTQLQESLNVNQPISFRGIGTLSKQSTDAISFQPESAPSYYPELIAERVIRKNIAHTVLVGEEEKTSDEMQAVLSQPAAANDKWWVAAIILAAIGIAAIVAYYVMHPAN